MYEYGERFIIEKIDEQKKFFLASLQALSDEEKLTIPFKHPHFLILYSRGESLE